MSSLKLAKGLTPTGRLLMIDTERGSGDLYADLFDYDIITLQPPYKPEKYVEAIRAGEEAGYDKPSSSTAYRTPGATKAAYSTRLRIPVMTTMRSGAWRPLDPVDEDHGGA